jgi:hypothetical protein
MPLSVFALFLVATSFFLSSQTSASLLTSTGSTIELGGIPYYVSSKSFASVSSTFYTQALADGKSMGTPWIPVTVVKATSATFGTTELQSTLKTFGDIDDVWTTGFLSGQSPKPRVCVPSSSWILTFEQVSSSWEGRHTISIHPRYFQEPMRRA